MPPRFGVSAWAGCEANGSSASAANTGSNGVQRRIFMSGPPYGLNGLFSATAPAGGACARSISQFSAVFKS
jgi:hypothetical protein